MDKKLKYVGNGVIEDIETGAHFVRIDSKRNLTCTLVGEETQYCVSAADLQIELKQEGHVTDAVMLSFTRENEELPGLPQTSFMDMLLCNLLGTFVSEWY